MREREEKNAVNVFDKINLKVDTNETFFPVRIIIGAFFVAFKEFNW